MPVTETMPDVLDFGIDLGRKPDLTLKTFTGVHDVRAAVSPDCSFQLLKETLDLAKSELLVYIYNVSADHILALLANARDRGVTVRIMYDATDTSGGEVKKLTALKVEIKVAPSRVPRRVFDVCHQKFAVIDAKTVFLGSANWADSSIPARLPGQKRKKGNREWLIRFDDTAIAEWYKTLFEADFAIEDSPGAAPSFDIEAAPEILEVSAPRQDPPLDLQVAHFPKLAGAVTPLVSPDNYFAHVKKLLESAAHRILLQQQYIVGGANAPSIETLLKIVAAKKKQGLDVRIIVSSRFSSGWQESKDSTEAHGLLENLKAINLDQFIHCHNKGVIVDDHVVVTSTNWSENSVRRAREAGVEVASKELTAYYAKAFEDDWKNGWTVAQGDAGPSFELDAEGETETVPIHPADRV